MKLSLNKNNYKQLNLSVLAVILVFTLLIAMLSLPPKTVNANQIQATCTNSPSDAATINAAIASSNKGDEVVIQGQCLINQVIILIADRSYRGQSRTGTVLKQADGANLSSIFASDSFMNNTSTSGNPVSLSQLTIDGNSANNTSSTDGIIMRSWQSVIKDIHIASMGGSGIHLTNKSANGTVVTNTMVNGQIIGNFIENSKGYGVFVEDSGNSITDWELMDNWIASSGNNAVHLQNSAGWNIERNHIYGVPNNAIYAHRLWGTTIADNYIEDFGSSVTIGTYSGIEATVQGGVASIISGNKVFGKESNSGSTYRYIYIHTNYGTAVVGVTGNVVRGAGTSKGTGFYYTGGTDSLIVASTGNAVNSVNTPQTAGTGVSIDTGI